MKRRRSRVGAANAAQAAMTDVMFSGIGIAGAILLIFVLARRPLIPPAESTMHVDVRLTSEVLKKATLAVIVRMPDGRVFANDHNEVNLDVGGQVAFEPRRTSDWTVVFGSEPPLGTTMTVVLADVDESSGVAWDVESAGAEIKSVFPTQVTVNMTLKRETGFAAAFEYAQGDRDAPASWRAWTGDAGSVQGPVRGSMAFGAATRVPNRPTSDPTGVFSKHLFKWNGTTLVEVSEGDVMTQAEVAVAWEQERGGRLDVWTGARSVVQHHRKRHQQQWRFGIEQGAAQTGQDDDKTLEKVEALVAREARNSTIANGGWSTWKTEPVGGVTFLIQDGPGASLLDNAVRVGTGACEWSIQPGVLGDPESIKTHVVEPLRDALQSQSGLRIGVGSVGGKSCVVSAPKVGDSWTWQNASDKVEVNITPISPDIPWWLIREDSTLVAADSRLAKSGYRLNASDLMPLAAMSFEACRKHGLRQNPRLRVSRATN